MTKLLGLGPAEKGGPMNNCNGGVWAVAGIRRTGKVNKELVMNSLG